jgi:DNA-3-methyladenine glycosylase
MTGCLPRAFYERSALDVARDLLGCRLVRIQNGYRLAGTISEAEAYIGEEDQACHARAGRTPRTEIMYGPPGYAYIYFTYGMHWLLNAVTGQEGFPAAVLLRGMLPEEGLDHMADNRPELAHTIHWTDGPAKLTRALSLDGHQNGCDLCDPNGTLFIEETRQRFPDEQVTIGPRVGLFSVPEPWKSVPWRFKVSLNTSENE